MQELFLRLRIVLHAVFVSESGQDLPEYVLTFTVIALGTVAGMNSVASGVTQTFSAVANVLTTAV